METNIRLPLLIDLAFCLLMLPFMIWLLPVDRWLKSNTLFVVLFVGWLYLVYLVNRRYTIPWLFRDPRHLTGAIAVAAVMIGVTYLISQYRFEFSGLPLRKGHHPARSLETLSRSGVILHQRAVWFLFVVAVTFSFAVGMLAELYRLIMERQAAEYEKKKAELALYKARINPHFLFNTLNTLYGLMLTDIARAETAFMQFMDMTRYMYSYAERDKVPLRAEIDYIRQYIELQKNRMNGRTHIHFSHESRNENPDSVIAPMILITFVENAFKYGVSSHRESDIHIVVTIDGKRLYFTAENPVVVRPAVEKSGFGIDNCRKRLNLLYPDRHRLEIKEQQDNYYVMLTLNLD